MQFVVGRDAGTNYFLMYYIMDEKKELMERGIRLTRIINELKYYGVIKTQEEFADSIKKHSVSISRAKKGSKEYMTENFRN